MARICYVDRKFTPSSMEIIDTANDIIDEYQGQGFDLTLRQLYYQFVARDYIPNKQSEYKRLGSIINDARLAGLIDWHTIVDRTRVVKSNSHWDNPQEIVDACVSSYKLDKWDHQEFRPEVWIEKEALVGIISGICRKLDIPYFACRGYVSQSTMWQCAQRLNGYLSRGVKPVIIHLGDHDPSGVDMTRDIQERLTMFGMVDAFDYVEVIRIALNMNQIEELNPPPNPAKLTDARAKGYIKEFGYESWELDALEPSYIVNLIEKIVLSYRNDEVYQTVVDREEYERGLISEARDFIEEKLDNEED